MTDAARAAFSIRDREPGILDDSNFAGLLERAANLYGARTALTFRGESVSFEAIAKRAGSVAAGLTDAGIGDGDVCAILSRSPVDSIAAFFAALAVGAIGINLNELYRPRQIEYVLSHSGASALLMTRDVLATMPRTIETTASVIVLEEVPRSDRPFRPVARTRAQPAQITYTSGSTGQPKGVLMSHGNVWAGVRVVAGYLDLRAEDRIASLLPFSFVYGFNQMTTALYVGATLVVERSTLAQEILETIKRQGVSVVAAVPPLWQQLINVPAFSESPIESLRILTNAGGRLPPETVRRIRRAQPQARLFLMYGLTEVFRSTFLSPDEVDAHPDSMGRAVPESVVYVVTESGELARPGEVGELVHGGPTVALGYLRDEQSTQAVFRANSFGGASAPPRVVFSGDLVRPDEEGRLYYVGRRDRMIKTMGFRVSPDEILDVVYASGLVREAAIVSEADHDRGERIVACVVMRDPADFPRLQNFCKFELPRYMHPGRYVEMSEIPRNASGKHDLLELKARLAL